jgi:sialic acid synthase SpsE
VGIDKNNRGAGTMKVGKHEIINFTDPYIIAEIGSNHNGQLELAYKLIDYAKEAGCHCVKFQSWTKDTIFSQQVYDNNFFLNDDYRNRTDYTLEQIVEEFSVSEQELLLLRDYCKTKEIDFTSTPFSKKEVDYLVDVLDVSFIKVASMDLDNLNFLDYIARKGKPVMLSTGFGTLTEIDRAVATLEAAGNKQIILLHCVSVYPPKDENVNLNNIDMLRANYPDYPIGFSDHTIGVAIPLAAIAKGACVIEKHFTLDKEMFGWDHKVSATKDEMTIITNSAKQIVKSLGSYRRIVSDEELIKKDAYRRSIVAAKEIPAGKVIESDDLDVKRPGTGISPVNLSFIIGKTAQRTIKADQLLGMEDF